VLDLELYDKAVGLLLAPGRPPLATHASCRTSSAKAKEGVRIGCERAAKHGVGRRHLSLARDRKQQRLGNAMRALD
jgi:hypothetical protein